jgi:hypothetical protein
VTGQVLRVFDDKLPMNDGVRDSVAQTLLPPAGLPTDFFLSPSLQAISHAKLPAWEVKFVVTELQSRQIEAKLATDFMLDPHATSDVDNRSYWTTTVYCDTPNFDTYFRLGRFKRRKYRLRRYGLADLVFLELKTKQEIRVRKQRCPIPVHEMARLKQPVDGIVWAGDWFRKRVLVWSLEPVLAVRYCRTAYIGRGELGPLRLTFDRNIAGKLVDGWQVEPFADGHPILTDRVICEFKFQGSMPNCFKAAIEEFQLSPAGASKYRLCLEAAGGPRKKVAKHA